MAAVLVAGLGVARAATESPSTQKMAISVNPIGIAFGIYNAKFVMKLDDKSAINASAFYWSIVDTDWWTASAFGVGAAYDFFFSPTALNGWYAGPAVSVMFVSITDKEAEPVYSTVNYYGYTYQTVTGYTAKDYSYVWFSIGGEIGYRWVLGGGFVVDLTGGLSYVIGSSPSSENTSAAAFNYTGISFGSLIGGSIGYAF